ncbi:hypothetical protein EZJ49_04180 [Bdellovibrio bacteriovorus]|uniref:hypothetical protein n=1 Tax=Bdellovibrio bacteriovorus TaxID=959 RepID=UPI0021CF0F98|nr:hypothetical protein [Bdellovibrio bacteriovorus]UXR65449.1 hypothetical protein EZJ49_04180 [Bdellovibrio bacteriovorus]
MTDTHLILTFGFKAVQKLLLFSFAAFVVGFLLHWVSYALRNWIANKLGERTFLWLFAPGIMIHEISHMLAALAFLHEIVGFNLFDPNARNGSHGHVVSRPRQVPNLLFIPQIWILIGDLFIGIAPLIVGPLLLAGALYLVPGGQVFLKNPSWSLLPGMSWQLGLWIYLFTATVFHMELSPADLNGTWKGFLWLVLATFLVAITYKKFAPYFH